MPLCWLVCFHVDTNIIPRSLLMFSLSQYLEDLKSIVSIDSGTDTLPGIKQVQTVLHNRFFKQPPWQVEEIHVHPDCAPVLKVSSGKPPYDLLISGHLDTVFPKGTVANWSFSVDETYAYGPGVADMKGGVLATCYAVEMLPKDVFEKLSICFFFTGDEEIGTRYSKEALKQVAKQAKAAFVAESTDTPLTLMESRKGRSSYVIEYKGIPAHSSVPKEGASAIAELLYQGNQIQSLHNPEKDISLNIGKIEGGDKINIISDTAKFTLECRSFTPQILIDFKKQVEKITQNKRDPKVEVTLTIPVETKPFFVTDKTKALQEIISQAAKKLNQTLRWDKSGGLSDGNYISSMGCPVVDGFSACGTGIHTKEEKLCLHEVEPFIQLMKESIILLAKK